MPSDCVSGVDFCVVGFSCSFLPPFPERRRRGGARNGERVCLIDQSLESAPLYDSHGQINAPGNIIGLPFRGLPSMTSPLEGGEGGSQKVDKSTDKL